MDKKYKIVLIVLAIVGIVSITLGISIAFFNYTRTGSANTVSVGRIYFNHEQGNAINLTNVFPIDVTNGIPSNDSNVGSVTINVTGDTTYTDGIEYLVSAVNVNNTVGSGNNQKTVPISIDVSVTSNTNNNPATTLGTADESYFTNRGASSNTSIYKVLAKETISEDDQLLVGYIKSGSTGVDGNIVIRAYIDMSKVAISDTYPEGNVEINNQNYYNGTTSNWAGDRVVITTDEWNALSSNGISFQVKVEANEGIWVEEPPIPLHEVALTNIENRSACMQKVTMVEGEPYTGTLNDGKVVYYYSDEADINTAEACLKNYVWYSGKLWRITAIYPDGKMKLVTENPMTAIMPSNVSWDSSYIKTWLEEEFLPTLYNKENIIVSDSEWNVRETSTAATNPYPTVNSSDKVTGSIGLLNAYEYTKSYTSTASNSYLNVGQTWWLMNSESSSLIWSVGNNGSASYSNVPMSCGVRPSINLQSNVFYASGEGTRNNPYMIKDDKSVASSNDNLTNRTNGINGEYVKFNNEVYRIIGREGTTTKIVKADYIRNGNTVVTKYLSSDVYYNTASADNTFWDYYLVNGWYNSVSTSPINYQSMIATNTSGASDLAGKYYKKVFTGGNYNDVLSDSANEYYYSTVGLLRYGEMFASQLSLEAHVNSSSNYSNMWLLTPYGSSWYVWNVNNLGIAISTSLTNTYGIRPTINLVSTVKITCNSNNGYTCDGTYFRPYDLTI